MRRSFTSSPTYGTGWTWSKHATSHAPCSKPFIDGEVDAIYLVYNEFKSAMTQRVVAEPLFPLPIDELEAEEEGRVEAG